MKPLTTKQAAILNFIMDHVEQNGYPPSIREIQAQYGFKALRGATVHLDALEGKGYIKRGPNSRCIKVLSDANGNETSLKFMVAVWVDSSMRKVDIVVD